MFKLLKKIFERVKENCCDCHDYRIVITYRKTDGYYADCECTKCGKRNTFVRNMEW